jgi:hypothetical protein
MNDERIDKRDLVGGETMRTDGYIWCQWYVIGGGNNVKHEPAERDLERPSGDGAFGWKSYIRSFYD